MVLPNMDYLSPSNITFALGILAIIFSVFNYFKNPQIKADKTDALIQQRVQWTAESTERRFKEMNDNFRSLLLQSNNHIHTIDTKVDGLAKIVSVMSNEITRLATIIEERIPKKL
jgi:hypothetical protein